MNYFRLLNTFLFLAVSGIFLLAGCRGLSVNKYSVALTIRNDSVHKLNWVKVNWPSGGVLSEGILFPEIFHVRLDFTWPDPPQSNLVLSFIEYGSQGKYIPNVGFDGNPKVYNINISLDEINKKIATGKIKNILVRIIDFDKAEISCE